MNRILVGVDDSVSAGTPVRWASRLAAAVGAEVVLVNIWLAPATADPAEDRAEELGRRRTRLERLWVREAENLGVPVRHEVFEGDPRQVLLEVAEGESADLTVVGRSGESGEDPGFLHLGSVAEYLAHAADRPLAVVPDGTPSAPPERVALGVDGSPASAAAVRWCADAASGLPANFVAVHVTGPRTERGPADLPDDWLHALEQGVVAEWSAPIDSAGATVTPIAVRGPRVGPTLVETAAAQGAQVIVVGTRGLGGFAGLRLGGTALRVLHRAEVPVVLVPAS